MLALFQAVVQAQEVASQVIAKPVQFLAGAGFMSWLILNFWKLVVSAISMSKKTESKEATKAGHVPSWKFDTHMTETHDAKLIAERVEPVLANLVAETAKQTAELKAQTVVLLAIKKNGNS